MVLEWTLGLPTPGSIFSAAVSVKGNMGDSEPLCVSLVLVSFTLIYRAACPLLVKRASQQWRIYDLIKGVSRVKYACAPTFSGEPRPLFDRGAVGSPGCARSVCVG